METVLKTLLGSTIARFIAKMCIQEHSRTLMKIPRIWGFQIITKTLKINLREMESHAAENLLKVRILICLIFL